MKDYEGVNFIDIFVWTAQILALKKKKWGLVVGNESDLTPLEIAQTVLAILCWKWYNE